MDSTIAALIGVVIGACAGVIGHIVNNLLQGSREKIKELRECISQLASTMGAAQQSMDWISRYGINYPRFKEQSGETNKSERIYKEQSIGYEQMMAALASSYKAEMKATWPKILGAIAAVALYDYKLYRKMEELVKELLALDCRVTEATMKIEVECKKDFAALYLDIRAFGERWMEEIVTAMHAFGW
jgi:hypothetical protein